MPVCYRTVSKHLFKPRQCIARVVVYFSDIYDEDSRGDSRLTSNLVFDEAREIFGHRCTRELLRAYFVLHACAIDSLVHLFHEYDLLKAGERVLGSRITRKLLSPFYSQFVAGDSEEELRTVAEDLSSAGINLMVAPMLETDINEEALGEGLHLFSKNFLKTQHLIDISSKCRPQLRHLRPICQTKITAHISADVLFKINKIYGNMTVKDHCAIVCALSEEITKLKQNKTLVSRIEFPKLKFSHEDSGMLSDGLLRLVKLGELCREKNVILAVDAETSYTNSAISLFTLALMTIFNDEVPVIWNTYQAYLKNAQYWLNHDLSIIQSTGASFGAKIVRGAYMERERAYAKERKLPDPVNETYKQTNDSYDSIISSILEKVALDPFKCQAVAATHNETSVVKAVQKMDQLRIPKLTPGFFFAQIYGMADNISIPLSKSGYSIYKSVPYGSMAEVMPYLARRADENRAVFLGARRERALLSQELRRRIKIK